jgi:membrane-associated phospholipid phosphatase
MNFRLSFVVALSWVSACASVAAQSAPDAAILRGLAPVSVLLNTDAGKADLSANYMVTGGIQSGTLKQPTLLPFAQQQEQALQDAFITNENLAQLADGLGTTLGAAYLARFHYIDPKHATPMQGSLQKLIEYATAVTGRLSNSAKYFFANGTTNGTATVSSDLAAILREAGGTYDIFGNAYHLPAGSAGAGTYGNSRPFQTEKTFVRLEGTDYFSDPADNYVYNRGPAMNLTASPSYPSGHTTYGYTGAVLLAVLVPERYAQMIARGAEYGNDRILMGSHYAMDVLGGRTLALYGMAHLLANDPKYMGLSDRGAPAIQDFRGAFQEARKELISILQAACGNTVDECAKEDIGRFSQEPRDESFYAVTQTYDLPVVYSQIASSREDVGKLAPEAGYLLTIAFPSLALEHANRILTETEGPGGGFLDNGSSFGVYSRLNLYAAARRAATESH